MKTIIKICGIKSPEMAAFAVKAGATHIGILRAKESKRFVNIELAQQIAATTIKMGAIPVGVFTDCDANSIIEQANTIGITHIQCHGHQSKRSHHKLPDNFIRIYAMSVDQSGRILSDTEDGVTHLDPKRDLLLFDREKAGSGKTFDHKNFNYHGVFPFIIAGGLNVDNAIKAFQTTRSYGVDTSSGVENNLGQKDYQLIEQFIKSIKC